MALRLQPSSSCMGVTKTLAPQKSPAPVKLKISEATTMTQP
jgi:hypothetical protein